MRRNALIAATLVAAGMSFAPLPPASAQAEAQPEAQTAAQAEARAEAKALPSVQVAARYSGTVARGETYYRSGDFAVWRSSVSSAFLSGFRNANGRFVVDDVLTMTVTGENGRTQTFRHDFSRNCTAPTPQPLDYLNLNKYLFAGLNTVRFALSDKCGDVVRNSDIFLSGSGVIDPAVAGARGCSGSNWVGGITGSPAFIPSTNPPQRKDRRVQGTAGLSVANRINCSASVQVALETKVCNRFGYNCNPRTIASTTIERLPAAGPHVKTLSADCRRGTHSYRMQVRVKWVTWTGWARQTVVPKFETRVRNTPDGDRGWTRISC
ncbi:hypothetical protein OHA21_13465 [Actinoplanes sp. NBC_00393]|uniref:hypothetical protein n=1 Tax=Actinoplanes sp. NBC_00393 TaxID=2975953 RepID=UPI002E1BB762